MDYYAAKVTRGRSHEHKAISTHGRTRLRITPVGATTIPTDILASNTTADRTGLRHRDTHNTFNGFLYRPPAGGADIGHKDAERSWAQRVTVIQVSNLVYESPQIHKEVEAGKDYPVIIDIDKKGVAKKLTVTVGGKTYTYNIARTREPKPK